MPLFHKQHYRLQSGSLTYEQRVIRQLTMASCELESPYYSLKRVDESLRGSIEVLREWIKEEEGA